ncbi:MAG: acyl-CoA dehydrogenase family protein [Burkholderiaceae bacterium]
MKVRQGNPLGKWVIRILGKSFEQRKFIVLIDPIAGDDGRRGAATSERPAPAAQIGQRNSHAAPAHFGTPSQRERFLKKIANLDIWFCLGMSEPGAGSDLASLRTSAHLEGDHYVVQGQKIWTSTAHHADWIYCMVRTSSTGRPQSGISLLLIDLKSPGITVRPIISLDRRHHFNEVFFDAVEVPVENRIGEENRGWHYSRYLLGRERTGIARVGLARERLAFAQRLHETLATQRAVPFESYEFRRRAALIEAELMALEATQFRVLAAVEAGASLGAGLTSLLKMRGSQVLQAATELAVDVAGPSALGVFGDEMTAANKVQAWMAPARGVDGTHAYARAASIYGGTNEIMKNIIAKVELGV